MHPITLTTETFHVVTSTASLKRLSRRDFLGFKGRVPMCVSKLKMRDHCVSPVAFRPSVPYLATGCGEETAKLWLLNVDCSAPTCVCTLREHSGVFSLSCCIHLRCILRLYWFAVDLIVITFALCLYFILLN
jgi:WD40 repeat protein